MGIRDRKLFPPIPACAARLAPAAAVALAERSPAQTIDGLEARIAAAREEAEALGAEIEAATAELAAAQQRAIDAARQEAELTRRLARGEARERRLEVAITEAQAEL